MYYSETKCMLVHMEILTWFLINSWQSESRFDNFLLVDINFDIEII